MVYTRQGGVPGLSEKRWPRFCLAATAGLCWCSQSTGWAQGHLHVWRWRQKAAAARRAERPAGGDGGHRVSLWPQILELVTSSHSIGHTREKLPFKQKNIYIYLVSSLWLSFKTPNFFSPGLPFSFLLGTRIPKLSLEPKFRVFGSAKGLKRELN